MNTHPTIEALSQAIRDLPIGPRWDPNRAMTLFAHACLQTLSMQACSWSNGMVVARCYAPILEPLEGVFTTEEQAHALSRCVIAYIEAVHALPPFTDVLTQVHAEFMGKFGGNGLGQHFTPGDLAQLMAAITADHSKRHSIPDSSASSRNSIYEACCGAGGLLLAQIQRWRGNLGELRVAANDIDPLCAAMTGLQLLGNQVAHQEAIGECVITVGNELLQQRRLAFASGRHVVAPSQDVATYQAVREKLLDLS